MTVSNLEAFMKLYPGGEPEEFGYVIQTVNTEEQMLLAPYAAPLDGYCRLVHLYATNPSTDTVAFVEIWDEVLSSPPSGVVVQGAQTAPLIQVALPFSVTSEIPVHAQIFYGGLAVQSSIDAVFLGGTVLKYISTP